MAELIPTLKRKILFLGTSTHLGGAERSLLEFIGHLRQSRPEIQVEVSLPKAQGPLIEELGKLGVPVHCVEPPNLYLKLSRQKPASLFYFLLFGLPAFCSYVMKLRDHLRGSQAQVIHSTGIKSHVLLCCLASDLDAEIVIHFRDLITSVALKIFFIFFYPLKNVFWISASYAVANTLLHRTQVFYDGFDEKHFHPEKNDQLKTELEIPPQAPLVALVGAVARWKGHAEFVAASAIVKRSHPDCHFAVIGAPIYDTAGDQGFFQELQASVVQQGLEDCFHFTGFKTDVPGIYNGIDLLVHCSTQPEPFGRVVVESLLCETPVVAAKAGGILEIIKPPEIGFLHHPGDVDSLAEAIHQALASGDLKSRAQLGRQKMIERFGFQNRYDQLATYLLNRKM